MEKATFELWESIQDNQFGAADQIIAAGADLNYQLQGYGSVPLPPPYYKLTVRLYYFPEHYHIRSTRLYANLCVGDTVLHICSREGFGESVKWLLRKKVDITLRNDRNKTAYDLATPEVKKIFEDYYAGHFELINQKPQTISLQEFSPSQKQARWAQIQTLLGGDPTNDVPANLFENWPLHESLKATMLLRQSKLLALEQRQQIFNSKIKLLKQAQGNLGILRERRVTTSRTLQELQLQLAAAEKQLKVIEVEEFRAQRETDELKAEYANESEKLGRLQKVKDSILQTTAPLINQWNEWLAWSQQQNLNTFSSTDVLTLLGALEVDYDTEEAIASGLDGAKLAEMGSPDLKTRLKITAYGDRKRLIDQLNRVKNHQPMELTKFSDSKQPGPDKKPQSWEESATSSWDTSQVLEWLTHGASLPELRDTFAAHKIDGSQAMELTDKELEGEMEVTSEELRSRFLQAIQSTLASRKREADFLESTAKRNRFDPSRLDGIPQEFLCKLTNALMQDPVFSTDGYTYERAAIERWFQEHDTSPVTEQPISKMVFPNHSMKKLISEFVAKQRR